MDNSIENNKRIAKNTLLLYLRMLILLFIGFFTSRVLLNALGVANYGINNVITGFLSMFSIITVSMSTAISRYITVELGKKDFERLKLVFSTSLAVQLVMAIILVFFVATFGYWFLINKMNIPNGRENAAFWCFVCATIATFIKLMNIPFNATIVAHEKMTAFAYMTIVDASLKLLICYIIYVTPYDKLVTYSILLLVSTILINSIYWIYSKIHFKETTFIPSLNIVLFKDLFSFAGWNFFGQTTWILNTQGVNLLMNLFFGVVVNAARGVATQVNDIIQNFVNNFMIALNPQIIKLYAAGDKEESFKLACRGSRFSFYIMFLLSLPVMLESKQILDLWLVNPPDRAYLFVIWTIITTLILLLGNTLTTLQVAHGDIKKYQLVMTLVGSIPFPLIWLFYRNGATDLYAYYIFAIIYWILIFVRFYLIHEMTGMPWKMYVIGVVLRCHLIGFLAPIIPLFILTVFPISIYRIAIIALVSTISTSLLIYLLGLETNEKKLICKYIIKYKSKFLNRSIQ